MRRKGLTPAALIMILVAATFLVFLVATRFGLDLIGPQLVDWMQQLHDATGWYEGAKAAGK